MASAGIPFHHIPSTDYSSITVAPHSGSHFGTPVLTHGAVHQRSAFRAAVEALLADVVGLRLDQGWHVSLSTVQLFKPPFGESIGNVAISTGHKGTTKFGCFSVFLFQNIPCSQIHWAGYRRVTLNTWPWNWRLRWDLPCLKSHVRSTAAPDCGVLAFGGHDSVSSFMGNLPHQY